jgi:hypothetical protein
VGRPGLDPGTLGIGPDHPTSSVVVQIAQSEDPTDPPASAEMLLNVSLWLRDWLHSGGSDVAGDVKICGADGLDIHVDLEGLIAQ